MSWHSSVSKQHPDAVIDILKIYAVRFLYVYLYIYSQLPAGSFAVLITVDVPTMNSEH